MPKIYRFVFAESDPEGASRQTASLAGLAISLAILVACVFLVKELHHKAMIEDCLMSGLNNCDSLVSGLH